MGMGEDCGEALVVCMEAPCREVFAWDGERPVNIGEADAGLPTLR